MGLEREIISWLSQRVPIGDDCAVLACEPWGTLLVTVDSVIDGVHAHWDEHGPEVFGYKAVARGMSDIAAMGGQPLWVVVAATFPEGATLDDAQALHRGAERAGCELVGGDTASGPVATVTATVLGRAHKKGPVLRSGARVGDGIFVTGPLGGSLASGRHHTFVPRVTEARRLLDDADLGAMIDLSDGLSTDLHHILEASGVGCVLEAAAIPLHEGCTVQNALGDGEDYELLFTAAGKPPLGVRIGEIVERGAVLRQADGADVPFGPTGYEHDS